ncbi:MAG: hypothetical protein KME28_15985 [Pelatocladus maniniholoensis HA4357-MV3]|jgi:hypothetical protein|uniref:Uncharacterized protein n=1 Tax=Pelatocladus maniniholoensis HA4357-MV3 TaxID=1117104 RepID=A0A9E3H9K9_9NOST|nr:hypothetical protein [Pelatocladus maniniholoensis HA4357-MV3]
MEEPKRKTKLVRNLFNYKGRSIRITQLQNGDYQAVAGGVYVIAGTEFEARLHMKTQIDDGW